jgi:hypothetical protein
MKALNTTGVVLAFIRKLGMSRHHRMIVVITKLISKQGQSGRSKSEANL